MVYYIQGLLFASLGFAWKERTLPIIIVISVLGILVAISVLSAIRFGRQAQANLQAWWESNLAGYNGPPRIGLLLPPGMTFTRFISPQRLLPWAFMAAWIFILIYCIISN